MVNLVASYKDSAYLYMLLECVMGGELFTYLQVRHPRRGAFNLVLAAHPAVPSAACCLLLLAMHLREPCLSLSGAFCCRCFLYNALQSRLVPFCLLTNVHFAILPIEALLRPCLHFMLQTFCIAYLHSVSYKQKATTNVWFGTSIGQEELAEWPQECTVFA